jgi:glycine betaine/choline ABC-type transport system substrate-binding protein
MLLAACGGGTKEEKPLVVGSKNFTESVILGELAAQTLERAGCPVERRLNMGGTFVCDTAIRSGAIDAYVEYSGTALTAILKQPSQNDRAAVERLVRAAYEKANLVWSPALGFNNTFAMIVRRTDADRLGLKTVSDLHKVAATYRPGFGYEFTERPDGWPGLQKAYGFQFAKAPRSMDLGLTYKAVAASEVDLIAGNSTDGLIDPLGLVILDDDKHFFPPYDAVIVRRADMPKQCGDALEALRGRIDDAAMRKLNYEVDGRKREVGEVVREWLKRP